ncbi:N-6 DNA methylase [Leptolyngbya sp. PCC 6406]|uniref:class I SAM-dependent DNA methyltransferase n=1 Tax=Leptolyngbya sp. PCC 6406 TaxID=1173264 RepID=UPI0002AC6546|nr:N-6 DNA methylase [Leptolyngbya sp. PCC 6406]
MGNSTHDIVAKLWNLCNILKDGAIVYHQYVTELTYLLFLKMAKETEIDHQLPEGYRWDDLEAHEGAEQIEFYRELLEHLSSEGSVIVKEIFADASTEIKKANTLNTLVTEIDKLDWYNAKQEGMGDIYEGLLEKNANESKAGAGQYFTPRALIDSMVHVMRPTLKDVIQDPAAGTGGFLISANRYIQKHEKPASWTSAQKKKHKTNTFYGMEFVPDTFRMGCMNLMLHGIESNPEQAGMRCGDTLSPEGQALPKASLILTNPPFGSKKGGGIPERPDFDFPTSNKQLCFLQHIYLGLEVGGRAAAIFPDNVLFESNVGRQIRQDLMDKCNLHTILRLPSGIFYAQGVKTNVLFFTRGKKATGNTKKVWVYDLRAHAPQFGKRTSLNRDYFEEFEKAFGDDPLGSAASLAKRKDEGESGKFRSFSREWIADRSDNLDITWLNGDRDETEESLPDPATLAKEAITELEAALAELQGILKELGEEVD